MGLEDVAWTLVREGVTIKSLQNPDEILIIHAFDANDL
jgi:hypothetical protein